MTASEYVVDVLGGPSVFKGRPMPALALLGSGEHLLAGLDLPALGYSCTEQAASDKAVHVVITKRA